MSVDVTLMVSLLGDDAQRQSEFDRAMLRRGWWQLKPAVDEYRVAFNDVENDEQVVQVCERDVKEAAYVAGVTRYQATCLIASEDCRGAGSESDDRDADAAHFGG